MANSADIKAGCKLPFSSFAQKFPPVPFVVFLVFEAIWIVVVLTSLGTVSYTIITHFVFQSVQVDGQSMVPTLANSGSYWLNRLAYIKSEPRQSDIVALKDPQDNVLVVKRIIALSPDERDSLFI